MALKGSQVLWASKNQLEGNGSVIVYQGWMVDLQSAQFPHGRVVNFFGTFTLLGVVPQVPDGHVSMWSTGN